MPSSSLFVLLVAGSAKCRKSTAIAIGEKILTSIKSPPVIFAQRITPEAIIQTLEEAKKGGDSAGLVCADELSLFMGSDSVKSGIIPVLISLYDSKDKWTYRTRSRGKEVLKNTTLTILAGTTQTDLKKAIPHDAIKSGFASRIIFVYQERARRPHLFTTNGEDINGSNVMDETPAEKTLRQSLIDDLSDIRSNVKGRIKFTAGAKRAAKAWYEEEWEEVRDDKVDGYYARKHDTMFKISALLSVMEHDERYIQDKHIKGALEIMAENEKHLSVITEGIASSAFGGDTERVFKIIQRHGKIHHSELLRKCWRFANAQELALMVRTLVESKEIDEKVEGNARSYEATDNISSA